MPGTVLLCAGGTGGHLFPAEAVAHVLAGRGWSVHLATDKRALAYSGRFPARMHVVGSATPFAGGPIGAVTSAVRIAAGVLSARSLVKQLKPAAAIGFGGYPTVPPVLAAWLAGVPTVLQEQNAVLGRANRFLAPRVTAIATGHPTLANAEALAAKLVHTGNPLRPAVREAAAVPHQPIEPDAPIRLLVFGGSQGARVFSERVPLALARLSEDLRQRLLVVQQCRPEDLEDVGNAYAAAGIRSEIAAFFEDMPMRIARSHLVISRAGASTVAELAAIGRPAIMVPLPHALDHDQRANATTLAEAGGGWLIAQDEFTPERLAAEIEGLAAQPARLAAAAAAARGLGRPDAAEAVADLVERVAAEGGHA